MPTTPHGAASLTSADIARVALKRLAELGLPPTPENYGKFYNAIATLKAPSDSASRDLQAAYQLLFQVGDLLDDANLATGQLVTLLFTGQQEIAISLDLLQQAESQHVVQTLLQDVISSTSSMHGTVASTHQDLQQLQNMMQQVQADLASTRQTLEQDALTGTLNRQGLDHLLQREVKRAQRHDSPLTVAMIDLDDFKRVNDQHGHLVGDLVLIHITNMAKAVLRESDSLVRYGGEEFLLLLPETDLNGGQYLIDRLRLVSAKTPFLQKSTRIDVRFSTGIAQLQAQENGHALLQRADHALYQAKQAGRDCVVVAGTDD